MALMVMPWNMFVLKNQEQTGSGHFLTRRCFPQRLQRLEHFLLPYPSGFVHSLLYFRWSICRWFTYSNWWFSIATVEFPGLHPGSNGNRKRWPSQDWEQVTVQRPEAMSRDVPALIEIRPKIPRFFDKQSLWWIFWLYRFYSYYHYHYFVVIIIREG